MYPNVPRNVWKTRVKGAVALENIANRDIYRVHKDIQNHVFSSINRKKCRYVPENVVGVLGTGRGALQKGIPPWQSFAGLVQKVLS
jgi:hypothetical protein